MIVIGSVMLVIGLVGTWIDVGMNGARYAEWANMLLAVAAIGAVLIGLDYYYGG